MRFDSRRYDHAMALATAQMEIVENGLRPWERSDGSEAFDTTCEAGLEH